VFGVCISTAIITRIADEVEAFSGVFRYNAGPVGDPSLTCLPRAVQVLPSD